MTMYNKLLFDTSKTNCNSSNSSLSLCFNYDSDDIQLLETVLPYVGYIETTPDSISKINNDGSVSFNQNIINQLKNIENSIKIVAHGVGLSIGSYDSFSKSYLEVLLNLCNEINFEWHSEHLGYTIVNGEYLSTMLPVKRDKESLNLICHRIHEIQSKIDLPFLLENIAHLIPDYKPEYSDAQFLNEITSSTNCGLILDVYNIYCDFYNFKFSIDSYLDELDLSKVNEIHIANGSIHKGMMLDIHSQTVSDDVLNLTQKIMKKTPNLKIITYELLPEAVPVLGYKAIENELKRIKSTLEI